jgi:flagella basal body P-ring formation protein FlgA
MTRSQRRPTFLRLAAVPLLMLAVLAPGASALAQSAPPPAAADEAQKPIIKYKSAVTEPVIRLGDLFDNAGAKANAPIEMAPAPGTSTMFQASKLQQIARAQGLDWKPASYLDHVVVERVGKLVTRETIESAIKHVIPNNGPIANLDVELAERALRMFVASDQEPTVAVDLLYFDPESRSFTIDLRAPADDPRAERIRVTGRAYTLVDIPILNRRVEVSDVIRSNDISWMRIRSNPGLANVLASANELVGKSPRRTLDPNQMIRQTDVGPHLVVQRNDTVILTLRTANMTLTVQGRALDEGAEGQTVRVLNTKSNKTVEGKVTGPGAVSVAFTQSAALR